MPDATPSVPATSTTYTVPVDWHRAGAGHRDRAWPGPSLPAAARRRGPPVGGQLRRPAGRLHRSQGPDAAAPGLRRHPASRRPDHHGRPGPAVRRPARPPRPDRRDRDRQLDRRLDRGRDRPAQQPAGGRGGAGRRGRPAGRQCPGGGLLLAHHGPGGRARLLPAGQVPDRRRPAARAGQGGHGRQPGRARRCTAARPWPTPPCSAGYRASPARCWWSGAPPTA